MRKFSTAAALYPKGLSRCPFTEIVKRSARREICDAEGVRTPGAPWGFQMSFINDAGLPDIKTVGFLRITEAGPEFLLKRKPSSTKEFAASLCYVEGQFPPKEGETCEQWRIEGTATEIDPDIALQTAPVSSFAQIISCINMDGKETSSNRKILSERESLIGNVVEMKTKLGNQEVDVESIRDAIVVYRINTTRVELLESGPIWERVEWLKEKNTWADPQRLLPY
mmetsp:Transcript_3626/g.4156  ORF Transcript_3626/g.4156 Transcript_3626/m.4156 type:complete len:225 (-) Transcript_3626:228-902(-)|eukprot:CAMPEP_0184054860 /NCGR_PEP_ID=MMETSP0956-20121227/6833_1 /TAXON_ID=627963 /ORGANISM="Aplanochytrium sp, Strain PBS07" /LENGTH=224 /DNA_ID=CAMNT_0026348575 /DNA_START=36 /DNA_END=710 /DNA_ORIENTATION=+